MISLLIIVIVVALAFDFLNGIHDCSNVSSTIISTNVLPMRTAIILAAVFNFIGALSSTAVAKTISSGFADPAVVSQYVVIAALVGACIWNLITWAFGLPSSSSHALIGGLAGAVVANSGISSFNWYNLYKKVLIPLVVSPTFGFLLAIVIMIVLTWIFKPFKSETVNKISRKMQLASSCLMAYSHGSNDSQKAMGIITLALLSFGAGNLPSWLAPHNKQVPVVVILSCAFMMAAGTLIGGKKIIKTMGMKIIKISPLQGFAAETAGATAILAASSLSIPVSTTHNINCAIMGAGASKRLSSVRWNVASNILLAWLFTLPAAFFVSYLTMKVFNLF